MMKMVSYEAFACPCGAGDVVLRESYKPKTRGKLYYACPLSKPLEDTFGCKFFLWKEERVRLLVGSPGASTTPIYSPGSSSTPIYSPGSSTPPRYSPGASTPPSYSLGTSRNAECSNCKHLLDKITGSMGITDKSKSIGLQVSGGNNTNKVPTGLFYWFSEGETPVFLLMDHHGELFLIQKGKVHWSHKTNIEMYSLFVSDGVNDYLDAGEDMFSYRHTPGLRPKVISHGSLEDLRVKLKRIYGNGIRATSKLVELDLDYQTGEVSDESTSERFLISIIKYDVLLSSLESPVLRWHLVFANASAVFPNTDFPCRKFSFVRIICIPGNSKSNFRPVNIVMFLCFLAMLVLSYVASVADYGRDGVPPTGIVIAALVIFAILGMPLAVSRLSMGVLNVSIVVPQVSANLTTLDHG
ncbi:retrotransposon protein, putative, ty1-copia subclass [Tanacetum coccineum]